MLKLKVDQYIDWSTITVNELRAHIALNSLKGRDLEVLLKQHLFSDEVTGWLYKYLYAKLDEFGRRADKQRSFTF